MQVKSPTFVGVPNQEPINGLLPKPTEEVEVDDDDDDDDDDEGARDPLSHSLNHLWQNDCLTSDILVVN